MQCVSPYFSMKSGSVPCGVCMACRINRTEEWATRIEHEMHGKDSCFITLTYGVDPETLNKKHLQDFLKRLRYHLGDKKIKYYGCGEYGDLNGRPHYHLIIIGWKPEDLYVSLSKHNTSVLLAGIWNYGFVSVGACSAQSIRYVTGYVRKKLYGKRRSEYGEKVPPFAVMSLGIGKDYCLDNKEKILRGYLTKKGIKYGLPRYYKKKIVESIDGAEELFRLKAEGHEVEKIIAEVGIDKAGDVSEYMERLHRFSDLRASDRERRKADLKARENRKRKGIL